MTYEGKVGIKLIIRQIQQSDEPLVKSVNL